MASVVLAVLGAACVSYGLAVLSVGSGTWFFAVWLALGAALLGLAACIHLGLVGRIPAGVRRGGLACLGAAGVALVAAVAAVAVGGFGAHGRPGLDYIVVLGAQVREDGPSGVLRHRIDAAYGYLAENGGTLCVVSGGQGPNEPWTEARGMKDYLVGRGIDPERIIEEGASASTVENLANSLRLIEAREAEGGAAEGDAPGIGIVTNDFHVLRATCIARKLGMGDVCGIAAPSDAWALPNNLLREALGLGKDLLAGNL